MKNRSIALAVTGLALAGCGPKPGGNEPGANEPGAKLVAQRCGACHPAGVKKAHAAREEWDQTVTRMMGKGAVLNAEEKTVVVDYLTKYHKP